MNSLKPSAQKLYVFKSILYNRSNKLLFFLKKLHNIIMKPFTISFFFTIGLFVPPPKKKMPSNKYL